MSLVDEELHWVIVVCLERGEEYLVERMQALKLIKKFMSIAGQFLFEIFAFCTYFLLRMVLLVRVKKIFIDDGSILFDDL